MNQPEFTAVFFTSFGQKPKRVDYSIRFGTPNSLHDLQFLSSLVHDASVNPDELKLRGDRLKIPLVRDCWELCGIEDENDDLYVAPTVLSLSPVVEMQWNYKGPAGLKLDSELMISGLHFSEEFWNEDDDLFDVVLRGDRDWWKIRITLRYEGASVRLRDKRKPVLSAEVYGEGPSV